MIRPLLRTVAVAIAVAGVADPVLTGHARGPRVTLVAIGDEAVGTARQVQSVLASDVEARMRVHREPSRAAACPTRGNCIVVSSGEAPSRLTADATIIGAV